MRKSNGIPAGGLKWRQFKTGGLGYVVGGSIASDGTLMACWADVGEAYVRESTAEQWSRVLTSTRMTLPPPAFPLGLGDDFGVYGMEIAPSNAGVVYLAFRGRMLRSTNRGVNFSDDSLNGTSGIYMRNNNGNNRTVQHKLKVDPNNAAVAYLGTQRNGLWRRLTAGWSQIASVPVSPETLEDYETVIVAIDTTSATAGSAPDVRYSLVFCSVNGKGIYKSTDGGTTFTQIVLNNDATLSQVKTASCTTTSTSTTVSTADTSILTAGMSVSGTGIPANTVISSITDATHYVINNAATASGTATLTFNIYRALHMIVGPLGNLFVVTDNNQVAGNTFKSTDHGTTFTAVSCLATYAVQAFEFDPKNSSRVTGMGGVPFQSLDGLSTINSSIYQSVKMASKPTACPLPASITQNSLVTVPPLAANAVPHPTLNKTYMWAGWGVFYINEPWSNPLTDGGLVWVEDNRGVEELVTYSAFVHPVSGRTFLSCGDRGLVWTDDNSKYATNNYPSGYPLADGTVVDYAIDDPTYLVTRIIREGFTDYGAYSINGGDQWLNFANSPGTPSGGAIAVSNKGQMVVSSGWNTWPRYCHDTTGTTWADCTFTGFANPGGGAETGFGFTTPFVVNRHCLVSDKQTPGAFYIMNYGPASDPSAMGVWESLDGGQTFNFAGCPTGAVSARLAWSASMFMVQGDLYLTGGKINVNWVEDAGFDSWRSTDKGRTWTALGQINNIVCMCSGKAYSGSPVGYALYAIGWKSGVYGLYRSDDKGVTWVSLPMYDNVDWVRDIAADPLIFGRVIVGYQGSGYAEGLYNFQLTVS